MGLDLGLRSVRMSSSSQGHGPAIPPPNLDRTVPLRLHLHLTVAVEKGGDGSWLRECGWSSLGGPPLRLQPQAAVDKLRSPKGMKG